MASSSSVLVSGAGDIPESFPISEHHNGSPPTEYTSSSSPSSTTSSRDSSFGTLSFSSYPKNSPIHSIFTLGNSGVPFSWEQHPGIPKKSRNLSRSSKKEHSSSSSALILLPLPPATCSNLSKRFSFESLFTIRKNSTNIEINERDPFVAALMKCSKDDDHNYDEEAISDHLCWKGGEDVIIEGSKSSSSRSRRFGFNFIDCKNSCSVVESNVLVPKYSSQNASYDLLTRRSG